MPSTVLPSSPWRLVAGLLLAVALGLALPHLALTQTSEVINSLNVTANEAQFKTSPDAQRNLNQLIGTIIKTLLGLTGVLFMILIVVAGDLWMTAGGNEEKITKARATILNAAIGLMMVFAAYLATNFLVDVALQAVGA